MVQPGRPGTSNAWKNYCLPMPTTKNGWPSVTYPGVEPNSPKAVASIAEESVGPFC